MKPTRRLSDWRLWAAISMAFMTVSVLICLVVLVPATYRAKTEAITTRAEASAGRRAALEVRKGTDAAACRATFNGIVVDIRADLDDARAAHQQALGDGLQAAFEDNRPRYVLAVAAAQRARADIDVGRVLYAAANNQYQALLAAQTNDPVVFVRMCRKGPSK